MNREFWRNERRMQLRPALVAFACALVLGCRPTTARPYFPPVTGAQQAELRLVPSAATKTLADALRRDSLPLTRIELRDGLLETPWFNAESLKPTSARKLGPKVVRLRAWVDPTRPGYSRMTIEVVYRPLADPSLSDRDLDREVPPDHPVAKRVAALVKALVTQYGAPEPAKPTGQ